MPFLELKEKAVISKQVDSIVGWENTVIYEPVWINSDHIESICFAGLTILKMKSGNKHEVQSTPQEIIRMISNDE